MENLITISNDYQNIKSAAYLAANSARELSAIKPRNWMALLGLSTASKKHCPLHGVSCPRFTPANHTKTQQGELS